MNEFDFTNADVGHPYCLVNDSMVGHIPYFTGEPETDLKMAILVHKTSDFDAHIAWSKFIPENILG